MGSDILDNFNKWLYPNIIAQNFHVAVISRPGFINSFLNTSRVPYLGKKLKTHKSRTIFHKNKPIWVFLKNKLLSISSSEIRKNQTYT
jgi:nicotinic acid mononucleotide adenylyltransferase